MKLLLLILNVVVDVDVDWRPRDSETRSRVSILNVPNVFCAEHNRCLGPNLKNEVSRIIRFLFLDLPSPPCHCHNPAPLLPLVCFLGPSFPQPVQHRHHLSTVPCRPPICTKAHSHWGCPQSRRSRRFAVAPHGRRYCCL